MPRKFSSKIFIDGGDPNETLEAKSLLGYIDGQTTNPTLIAKNPLAMERIAKGDKFDKEELISFYKKVVVAIASIVDWSVSIEPYVDKNSSVEQILTQAREMYSWAPAKAWIKFPATFQGLEAAYMAIKEGIRVNMTLVFSQEQAASIYVATRHTKEPVFVSPFVGRLDDQGEDGMQLVANILRMYQAGDGHVLTLTASVRSIKHLLYALKLGSPVITVPFKVFKQWGEMGFPEPSSEFVYDNDGFKPIPYREITLEKNWREYDFSHPLTDIGIGKFCEDWNKLVR